SQRLAGSDVAIWQGTHPANGWAGISQSILPIDSSRVQRTERSAASPVRTSGLRIGARQRRQAATQGGGAARLPFPLCLPGDALAGLHRSFRVGCESEISPGRVGLGELPKTFAAGDRG